MTETDSVLQSLEEQRKAPEKFRKIKQDLPILALRESILRHVQANKYLLIKGETGSGKTTQVPQYILEDGLLNGRGSTTNVLVIQPRRIAAISVATRIGDERGHNIRQTPKLERTVGYEVRFESEKPRKIGAITVCTPGIVQHFLRSDPDLGDYSHVILDEVHERDLWTDVLLGVLKCLHGSSRLKIIVMSASLDTDMFSKYLNFCPVIDVPGRTFEIERLFLEDYLPSLQDLNANNMLSKLSLYSGSSVAHGQEESFDSIDRAKELNVKLLARLVHKIHNENGPGALLVFLPGWDEISQLHTFLSVEADNPLWLGDDVVIYTLHSQVDLKSQMKVFAPPEAGIRKVILSTNLAETSLTIDDVVYVVDSGRVNVMKYNTLYKVTTLTLQWVCKSSAMQRAGRAGRVSKGKCWHLYSYRHYKQLTDYVEPEIRRLQLEGVVLSIKSLELPIESKAFMKMLIEPPDSQAVADAINLLIKNEALDCHENMTLLGQKMSFFPLHPLLSKMLIYGVFFKCLGTVLSIVCVMSARDPFVIGNKRQRERLDKIKLAFAKGQRSDHLMLANMMTDWEKAWHSNKSREFCAKNCLNESVLDDIFKIKGQLLAKLSQCKLIADEAHLAPYNTHSKSVGLVKGVIAGSFYPQVRLMIQERRGRFYFLAGDLLDERMYINQKSINKFVQLPYGVSHYLAYFLAKVGNSGSIQIQDSTALNKNLSDLFTPQSRKSVMVGAIPDYRRKIKIYVQEALEGRHLYSYPGLVADIARFIEDSNFD